MRIACKLIEKSPNVRKIHSQYGGVYVAGT